MLNSYKSAPLFVRQFVDTTIAHEGDEFTNIKEDSGGATKYGVTEKSALRAKQFWHLYNWDGNIETMPLQFAQDWYVYDYYLAPKFNLVAEVSQMIAGEMFDTGVNVHPVHPIRWLQEELNLCNRRQKDYSNIAEDGKLGKGTVDALRSFLAKRGKDGEKMLYNNLNCCQQQHYRECALNDGVDDKDEVFYVGWCMSRLSFK